MVDLQFTFLNSQRMKTIAYILSIYLLFLGLFPCSDEFQELGESELVTLQESHSHNDSDCADDNCSPFCVCSCCQIQVHLDSKGDLATQNPAFSELISFSNFHQSDFKNRYSDSVFRPPIDFLTRTQS
jgi:hypothetical protein